MDVEDVLAFRVDDFFLSKLDLRVLVYYGIEKNYNFFIGIVEEGSEEKNHNWYDLHTIGNPWNREFKQFCLANVNSDLYTVADENGFFEGMNKQEDGMEYRKAKQYLFIRAKKVAEVIEPRMVDIYESYLGLTYEQMHQIFQLNYRLNQRATRELHIIPHLKNNWSDEEFSLFLSDMMKLTPSHGSYVIQKLDSYKEPDFDDYLFEVKTTPNFVKRCKYRLSWADHDEKAVEKLNPNPKNRIQYFMLYMMSSVATTYDALVDDPDQMKKYGKNIEEMKKQLTVLKKMAKLDLRTWHVFKEYMHIKGPYSFRELHHMMNMVFDGIMIYENSKDRTLIREIVKENDIKFVEVKGSPRKIVQRAVFNHRQAVEVEKLRLLRQKNEPMPLPPVNLPEWIENIRMKTKHDLIIAGLECNHCIGSYTFLKDMFVRENNVCAQIRRYDLSIAQCFDVNDQITRNSEDLRKRLEKALTPVAEKYNLRKMEA